MADELTDLVLVRASDGRKLNVIGSLVEDGVSYDFTYDGASTVTLALSDPDWDLVSSDFFDIQQDGRIDAVDVHLDGLTWRLTQFAPADSILSLTFEELPVQWLRFKFGHVTASRHSMTRAEFARRLVKSVGGGAIGFYSRELDDRQPVANGTATRTKANSKDAGVGAHADITIKGQPADSEQRRNIDTVLQVAGRVNASEKAIKAALVAGIGESEFRSIPNGTGSPYGGVFQGKIRADANGPAQFKVGDTEGEATHFFQGGKGFQGGGAIAVAAQNSDWTPGHIAYVVEGDRSNFPSDVAAEHFYQKHADEADKIMKAAGTIGGTTTIAKSYQFSVAKDESYWDAIQRLAGEVNWRAFMHRGVLYFMDDYQLLQGTSQWSFDAKTAAELIGHPSFEWDHRPRFPQEMSFQAVIARGFVAPGDVVSVTAAGPGNGRWLVKELSGSWFQPTVSVTLAIPQAPKKEPAPDSQTVDTPTNEGGAVLAMARRISAQNLPYAWGGGHNAQFAKSADTRGTGAIGYDCSGYVSACLHAAGLLSRPMTSGELMKAGAPGKGKDFTVYASPVHTFIIFEHGDVKRADTSPQGGETQRGPHVRYRNRSTAGFVARNFDSLISKRHKSKPSAQQLASELGLPLLTDTPTTGPGELNTGDLPLLTP